MAQTKVEWTGLDVYLKLLAKGLYYNINQRKKKGISRSKSESTISKKAYKSLLSGFKK